MFFLNCFKQFDLIFIVSLVHVCGAVEGFTVRKMLRFGGFEFFLIQVASRA